MRRFGSGAALAQDRGSLEAKVKSLTTQVSDLRLQTQVSIVQLPSFIATRVIK